MKKGLKMLLKILIVLLIAVSVAGVFLWNEFGKNPSKEEIANYEKLSYFKDGIFQSPQKMRYDFKNVRNGPSGFMRFLAKSPFVPKKELPKVVLDKASFPIIPENFAVYWLGHSAAIMEISGKRIIFDPVFDNAAPIPMAVSRYGKSSIARKDLPVLDYIIITHNHYDHLEKKTVQAIKTGQFIVPLGLKSALVGWGVAKDRIIELGWNEAFEKDGLKFVAQEGVHYSSRSPFDRNKTLWNSYVIISPDKKVFWGGDSGYGEHFARIGAEYGGFDFAALEIDGWNTGWPNTHLFPSEVVQAAKDLRVKNLLPIHWAVFDLALHPWHESIDMVLDEAKNEYFMVLTPKMGEVLKLGNKTAHWWKGLDY